MSGDTRFDIWMRDPYRWEPEDGPWIGYGLHYSDQTLSEVTETLHLTAYWDVAIVEAGKQPFLQDSEGRWKRSDDVYMVAQCFQQLAVTPGSPKSLADLFQQTSNGSAAGE